MYLEKGGMTSSQRYYWNAKKFKEKSAKQNLKQLENWQKVLSNLFTV